MASPTLQFKRGLFVNLPALRAGEPGFTTDKNELYIGIGAGTTESNKFFGSSRYWTKEDGSNALKLNLVDGSGNNSLAIKAPNTLADSDTVYTLPAAPTDGYYLKTNASGTLEWASVTDGASFDNVTINNSTFTGISTFSGAIDANAGLDVSGGSTFDNINVTGIGTIGTADINGGNIDGTVIGGSTAAAGTFTELAYDNSSTSGISTVGSLYVGADSVLTAPGGILTLSNIEAIDEVTKATLEASLALDPNDFDTLNVTGISTIGGLLDANGGLDVLGHTELDSLNVSGISTIGGLLDANGGLDVLGHTELDDLNVTGIATFTSAIDADLLGNAGTATSLATARNFEISGDIVATAVSFDGTGNVNLVANIQENSVGLGTDTFGVYVATVAGTANQIAVSGSGGETAAVVLSLPDDVVVGTSLSVTTVKTATIQHSNGTEAITITSGGNVGVSTNLTVSGNLNVLGSTTTVNTETLLVKDSLIEVGLVDSAGTLVPPSTDANIDAGMVFHYYDASAKKAAVYWDDSVGRIKVASEVTESNSILTAAANGALEIGGLYVAGCEGSPVEVIGCVNGEVTITNAVIDGGAF